MIECIICFIVGGLSGALVMSLCAVSKNSNEILEDGSVDIAENEDINIYQKPDCTNCEPENCKEDCCHNCYHSDGVFCDELERYITKGYGWCGHYERRERLEEYDK